MTRELDEHDARRQRALFNEVRHELLSIVYIELCKRGFPRDRVKEAIMSSMAHLDALDREALTDMDKRAEEEFRRGNES